MLLAPSSIQNLIFIVQQKNKDITERTRPMTAHFFPELVMLSPEESMRPLRIKARSLLAIVSAADSPKTQLMTGT